MHSGDGSRERLALSSASWSECSLRFATTVESERICCLTWCKRFRKSRFLLGFVRPLLRSDALAGVGIALANTLLDRRMAFTCDFAFGSFATFPRGLR